MTREPWEEVLADAFRASEREGSGHPEDAELAAYLERSLVPDAAAAVEAHLATCAACRGLVAGVADAVAEPVNEPAAPVGRGVPWRLTGLAAVLALGLGLSLFVAPWRERPEPIGDLVSAAEMERAGPELAELARRAARGDLPAVTGFDPFPEPGADEPALRGASHLRAPVPLEPRWSVVREPTPELRWLPPPVGPAPIQGYEVLLVDEEERLLARRTIDASGTGPDAAVLLSGEGLPALEPGTTCAWKVNARVAGEWLSSSYVVFRRADEEEARRLSEALVRAPENAFLRAVLLAARGFDRDALEELEALAPQPAGGPVERLARSILERMRLPEEALEGELRRRLRGPTESP